MRSLLACALIVGTIGFLFFILYGIKSLAADVGLGAAWAGAFSVFSFCLAVALMVDRINGRKP
jgi:uncharacterized MnhB-related membrane protein